MAGMGFYQHQRLTVVSLHLRGRIVREPGAVVPVTSTDLTDAGVTGRELLTSATPAAARTALGNPEGVAVADVAGTAAATYDAATQATINELKAQLNALLASLRTNNTIA